MVRICQSAQAVANKSWTPTSEPLAWSPPQPGVLTVDRATAVLTMPVLDGPPPVDDVPDLIPSTEPRRDLHKQGGDGWWRRDIRRTDDELQAETGYGGEYRKCGRLRSGRSRPFRFGV